MAALEARSSTIAAAESKDPMAALAGTTAPKPPGSLIALMTMTKTEVKEELGVKQETDDIDLARPLLVVKKEEVSIPVLAARPAEEDSSSSDSEKKPWPPPPKPLSLSQRYHAQLAQEEEIEPGPLERFLLRGGEILESYAVNSKVLRRKGRTS